MKLMRMIDEEYTRHPFYGSRKIRDYLRHKGYKVNWKRIQRLMRLMGLESPHFVSVPAFRILTIRCIRGGSVVDTGNSQVFLSSLRKWCPYSEPLSQDSLSHARKPFFKNRLKEEVGGFCNFMEEVLGK